MMAWRPEPLSRLISSISALPRTVIEPRPVRWAAMMPPGPG
jgi:hypothetical protein